MYNIICSSLKKYSYYQKPISEPFFSILKSKKLGDGKNITSRKPNKDFIQYNLNTNVCLV